MIYQAYEAARRSTRPLYHLLNTGQKLARDSRNPLRNTWTMRTLATVWELPARAMKDYGKPRYQVWEELGDTEIGLQEEVVQSLPFADLLHFPVDDGREKPKVLIAAALSGHFATLLQDTIRGFARDFDTYITDWKDARQVPLSAGDFGFDDYVSYLIQFIETMGPNTHLVATCQAAPPAMVAVAIMEARGSNCVPASLTLMGGPVDTRLSPNNALNKLTTTLPLSLFKKLNIDLDPDSNVGLLSVANRQMVEIAKAVSFDSDVLIMDDVLTVDRPVVFAVTKDRPILFSALAWADILLTLDEADFGGFTDKPFYGLAVLRPGVFLKPLSLALRSARWRSA